VRTSKPTSTISFNSPEFLALKLEELRKSGVLSFWAFIKHKPEDDEGGKKEHCHVFVEPAKMLQTDDLREALREFDPTNPTKTLGTITWGHSKFADWYLYGLHDKRYLAMKGQTRRFHYAHEEFKTSDDDDLLYRARSIDLLALSPYADMEDAIKQGLTWGQYFARGTVPLPLIKQFQTAWFTLADPLRDPDATYRNGREGHPYIDNYTGEVFGHSWEDVEPEGAPFGGEAHEDVSQ
jgi:hypothetical protein